jgi:hypothetical protein
MKLLFFSGLFSIAVYFQVVLIARNFMNTCARKDFMVIVEKYQTNNHAEPVLEILNAKGENVGGAYFQLLRLWDAAQIGDSVYKAPGSIEYDLIKPDTTLSFYPVCGGRELR